MFTVKVGIFGFRVMPITSFLAGGEGTALHLASDSGHLEVVQLLVANGADVNDRGGCS